MEDRGNFEEVGSEESGPEQDKKRTRKQQDEKGTMRWLREYSGLAALVLFGINMVLQSGYRGEARVGRAREAMQSAERRITDVEAQYNELSGKIMKIDKSALRRTELLSQWSKLVRQSKKMLPPLACEAMFIGKHRRIMLFETPDGSARILMKDARERPRILVVAQNNGAHIGLADSLGRELVQLSLDEADIPNRGPRLQLGGAPKYVALRAASEGALIDCIHNENRLALQTTDNGVRVALNRGGASAGNSQRALLCVQRDRRENRFTSVLAIGTGGEEGIPETIEGPTVAIGNDVNKGNLVVSGEPVTNAK